MSDEQSSSGTQAAGQPPLKLTALRNFKETDDDLAKIIGRCWRMLWASESPAIPQRIKYRLRVVRAGVPGGLSDGRQRGQGQGRSRASGPAGPLPRGRRLLPRRWDFN